MQFKKHNNTDKYIFQLQSSPRYPSQPIPFTTEINLFPTLTLIKFVNVRDKLIKKSHITINSCNLHWNYYHSNKKHNESIFDFKDTLALKLLTSRLKTPRILNWMRFSISMKKHPVSTRHRFEIHATSITLKRRRTDVKTTLYWAWKNS